MDTNSLIKWVIGAVLIAVGLPLYYLARYLEAPEDTKKRKARNLKGIAIIWMSVGVILYLVALITWFVS